MPRSVPVVLAAAFLLFSAVPAHAVLITVDFGGGFFTFDSGIIPTGGGVVGDINGNTDYSSTLSYTNAGKTWTESDAGVNYLKFDLDGNLLEFFMGGDVDGINTPNLATDSIHVDDFFHYRTLSDFSTQAEVGSFRFTSGGGGTFTVSPSPPYAAPEPSTLILLTAAMVGAVVRRRS